MIRNLDIFKGLLGWKQGLLTLDTDNKATTTGRFYNDFSPLVTCDNIQYMQQNSAIDAAGFNAYLKSLVSSSIQQLFNSLFREDDLVENISLYPYEMDFSFLLNAGSKFKGYEISVSKNRSISTVLNTVTMNFESEGTIKLLLFHSSKKTPVYTKEITVSEDTVISELDWVLDKSEGKYYIGYISDQNYYNRQYQLSNVKVTPIGSYFKPILVDTNLETLFDINKVRYTSETYGLNFDLSTWKDFTNVATQNKTKFVDAIGMQVCVNCLDLFLNSTRSNAAERIAKGNVMVALDGFKDETGLFTQGLRHRLSNEIKRLRKLFIDQPIIKTSTLS